MIKMIFENVIHLNIAVVKNKIYQTLLRTKYGQGSEVILMLMLANHLLVMLTRCVPKYKLCQNVLTQGPNVTFIKVLEFLL